MRVFGRYFAHRAKSTLARFLIIAVLTLIYLLPQLMKQLVFMSEDIEYVYKQFGRAMVDRFNSLTVITCILCTVIPILEFSSFHNRKNADTMLSMPISRPKLALVHFLNGAWQIAALVTCYISMYAVFVYQNGQKCYEITGYALYGDMKMFIPYYFVAILSALMVYSFFVLVFNFANNVADGVVFVLAYTLAGWILGVGVDQLFRIHRILVFVDDLIPYTLIIDVDENFFDALMNEMFMPGEAFKNGWMMEHMITPALIAAVGILVFLGCLICLFKFKKAEKIEGISNSPFGYALLIPLYGMSISAILFSNSFEIQTSAFIIIPMVVGYMIYRRSFKLKIIDLIMLALTVGMMIVADPISEIFLL